MNEANTSDFNCLAYRPTNRLTEINAYNFCTLFNLENCLQDQLPEVAVCNRWLCGCGSLRTGAVVLLGGLPVEGPVAAVFLLEVLGVRPGEVLSW